MSVRNNIKLLTWFNFFTDFKLYAAIAIIYFAQVTGSYALGMSIFSVAMISSALFEIPTGIYSDRIGRRKTMIIGAASAVIYSIFYAIGGSYWILVIGALFEGLSRSLYSGNNDALLHDTLTQINKTDEYDNYLGKVSSMFQIALACSAILGGFIAEVSFAWVMWLSVFSQITCLIISFFIVEPKTNKKESGNIYAHLTDAIKQFRTNKKLQLMSIASIISYGFGEASYQFRSAFYASYWPIWAITLAKAFSNLGASVSFFWSGKVIKRFNALPIIIATSLYDRIFNGVATLFPSFLSPLIMSSSSLFFGVSTVAKNVLFQKEFKSEQRATMGSLNSFGGSIFFGIVSFALGLLADKVSPAVALFIFEVLRLPALWMYIKVYKHDPSH
jgi:MFS family permease